MIVVPLVNIPARITELLHWADPFFSTYLIGLRFLVPVIINGKFLFLFNLNLTPNLLNGSDILLKSLLDKLYSTTDM